MQQLKKIFSPFQPQITQRYFALACDLANQLNEGKHYRLLGGCRLSQQRQYVRFKLGAYRLIFKLEGCFPIPHILIHRKNLESFLKRRCNKSAAQQYKGDNHV